MTLTEFLLARIAEDESAAKAATPGPWFVEQAGDFGDKHANLEIARWRGYLNTVGFGDDQETAAHVARHDPTRVLAECEAKRQIVEHHPRHGGVEDWMDAEWVADMDAAERAGYCRWCTYDDRTVAFPCPDLLALALPYADHPDYRQEWKP